MASRKLPVSPRADDFLRDVLHLGGSRAASARKIFGVGSLEGPLFEFSAGHASLELLAPAVPMLMNAAGQTAGLGVDNGTFRLVYWPFHLWQLNGALIKRLMEASLPFLRQGPAYETVLEVPDPEMMGAAILLDPGRGNAIGARVRGQAEAATLVVRLYPEMELVADLPMALRSSQEDERKFEVLFQPPAPEQYQLSLRLYDAAGRAHLSTAHLRVAGMRFSTWRPVLVFLHEGIRAEHRAPLLTDLNAALQAQGLEADIVTRAPAEQELYEYLLDHYLDDGELGGAEPGPGSPECLPALCRGRRPAADGFSGFPQLARVSQVYALCLPRQHSKTLPHGQRLQQPFVAGVAADLFALPGGGSDRQSGQHHRTRTAG